MGLGGVAEGVEHLQSGVQRGVKADGLLGGGDIVIDGGGNTDGGNAVVGQIRGTAEGTVTAYGYDRVDLMVVAGLQGLGHTLSGLELGATAGVQNGAAAGHDVGNADGVKGAQVALAHDLGIRLVGRAQKACVAAQNAHHLKALAQGATGGRANGGVHTGGVATRGKDTDFSEFSHSLETSSVAERRLLFVVVYFCPA